MINEGWRTDEEIKRLYDGKIASLTETIERFEEDIDEDDEGVSQTKKVTALNYWHERGLIHDKGGFHVRQYTLSRVA